MKETLCDGNTVALCTGSVKGGSDQLYNQHALAVRNSECYVTMAMATPGIMCIATFQQKMVCQQKCGGN
jgi:hypothetical protein